LPRALSSLVKMPNQKLSRHEYYVHLCDILLDLAAQEKNTNHARRLTRIASSLAHDLLNLATLTGRLLWYEGATPNLTRSPDLVSAAVDAESCITILRSACDIAAEASALYCVIPKNRGKIYSEYMTLGPLLKWAPKAKILLKEFSFLTETFDWFEQLREFRDDIVHRGWGINIYTERDYFRLIPDSRLAAERKWLGMSKQPSTTTGAARSVDDFSSVLAVIQSHAKALLKFTEMIAIGIEGSLAIISSRTHALSGMFVPALHHLNDYQHPVSHFLLNDEEKQRRKITAWYLIRIGDYIGAAQLGYPHGYWWEFIVQLSVLFVEPPVYMSEPSFSDDDKLRGFYIVFNRKGATITVLLADSRVLESTGRDNCQATMAALASQTNADRTLLATNGCKSPWQGEEPTIDLVASADPLKAAELVFNKACD